MIIKGLNFIETRSACPEQYEVKDEQENMVGYVRLRYGGLTCEYSDVSVEVKNLKELKNIYMYLPKY